MAKTTNLYVRLEPGLKEQAESILEQLGIPVSNAVNIFLRNKLLCREEFLLMSSFLPLNQLELSLTESELDAELEKGFSDLMQGNTKPAAKAFSDIRRDYGI